MHGADLCLECNPKTLKLYINKCDAKNPNMLWKFGKVNETALANFDDIDPNNNNGWK